MPYPKQPYIATHQVTYASGFVRDLVPYGDPCEHEDANFEKCSVRTKTFLDGGTAACEAHLQRHCKHGAVACAHCPKSQGDVKITKIRPRRAR